MASLAISLAVGASQHEIDARAKAAEERAQQQASKQALRDEKEAEVSRAATADEGSLIIQRNSKYSRSGRLCAVELA